MDRFVISGGRRLSGEVEVSGAKNSALILMACAILASQPCSIVNVPAIKDVFSMIDLLNAIGARCTFTDGKVEIDPTAGVGFEAPYGFVKEMRASIQVMGPLLAKLGKARVSQPGGCELGPRPIDYHVKGFQSLGCIVAEEHGYMDIHASKLVGSDIYLDFPSVGATENIMAAASTAQGTTIIHNAAKEPEIIDQQNFLNCMGARIRGAGTDTIRIDGVPKLTGVQEYSVIPDRIEAGTFVAAAAITGGEILIRKVIPEHLEAVLAKYSEMGVDITTYDDSILVRTRKRVRATNVKSLPFPGFPTDMQPQTTAVLSLANGTSIITENVFSSRYKQVDELRRMGADIRVEGKVAIVTGVEELSGAVVQGSDLRATAALVLAGLAAQGETLVEGIIHLDRGYDRLEEKLSGLGAVISRNSIIDGQS